MHWTEFEQSSGFGMHSLDEGPYNGSIVARHRPIYISSFGPIRRRQDCLWRRQMGRGENSLDGLMYNTDTFPDGIPL